MPFSRKDLDAPREKRRSDPALEFIDPGLAMIALETCFVTSDLAAIAASTPLGAACYCKTKKYALAPNGKCFKCRVADFEEWFTALNTRLMADGDAARRARELLVDQRLARYDAGDRGVTGGAK